MKPVLISGIQPTGKLHIGNYLGALKNFVELQNSGGYKCYFFIADLHSLTGVFDSHNKPKQIFDLALDYLAAGLNPEKSVIFVQSQVAAHSELAWILNTIASFGELKRMVQFKEKSGDRKENVNVGLFDYPVLQAADILLYNSEVVPVGEDQLQHLEFVRSLARRFNGRFGKTFVEPEPILTSAPRLMSLDDPCKKMSKSRPAGCLFMDDSSKVIREKIKRAVTDSGREIKYDLKNKPAISNLMKIYSSFSGKKTKEVEEEFKNKNYGDFKRDLAEVVASHLADFQKEKKKLTKEPEKIMKILNSGAEKANTASRKTMKIVRKKIGLI